MSSCLIGQQFPQWFLRARFTYGTSYVIRVDKLRGNDENSYGNGKKLFSTCDFVPGLRSVSGRQICDLTHRSATCESVTCDLHPPRISKIRKKSEDSPRILRGLLTDSQISAHRFGLFGHLITPLEAVVWIYIEHASPTTSAAVDL